MVQIKADDVSKVGNVWKCTDSYCHVQEKGCPNSILRQIAKACSFHHGDKAMYQMLNATGSTVLEVQPGG